MDWLLCGHCSLLGCLLPPQKVYLPLTYSHVKVSIRSDGNKCSCCNSATTYKTFAVRLFETQREGTFTRLIFWKSKKWERMPIVSFESQWWGWWVARCYHMVLSQEAPQRNLARHDTLSSGWDENTSMQQTLSFLQEGNIFLKEQSVKFGI